MIRLNTVTVFKLLTGVLLVQGVTAVLVFATVRANNPELWPLFGVLAIGIGVLAAFWFSAISAHRTNDALSRAHKEFYRERERVRVKAEQEKSRLIKDSHRQIAKERNSAQRRASAKVGLSFAAVGVLGIVMLLTQFVTFGLFTLSGVGGAAGGYLLRARQDRKAPSRGGISGPKENKTMLP